MNQNISLQNRKTFGDHLKFWRQNKNLSQMDLALNIGISTKHLSFVETGRSKPSRSLVCKIAQSLKLPLRQQNVLLNSAGYNSEFREESLDNKQYSIIKDALDRILENHNPYPAFVINTAYDIKTVNQSFISFVTFLIGKKQTFSFSNIMDLTFDPKGLSGFIQNWEFVSQFLLSRIWEELHSTGNPNLEILYKKLLHSSKKNKIQKAEVNKEINLPVMPLTFTKGKDILNFFSTITTFGTPLDLTCQELRIESLYPADESSKKFLINLSKKN